jgi:bifunctional UDP-N-acetylglucosamine pyrophosphorylase/glucosamine-1-phosphate N-acetyltransferase
MKSRLPKVLHRLAGRALVQHVIDTAAGELKARKVVVITGHGATEVEAALRTATRRRRPHLAWNLCARSRSWAPATRCSRRCPCWPMTASVVVLSGDVPLTQADTLRSLIQASALASTWPC